jgi:hypothetical protein
MNQLSNPHYLYLHSSIATQAQVKSYILMLIQKFEKTLGAKLEKEFIVNTVTKYNGTPLRHSYVWFKSAQTAGLFINKDLQGNDRVEEVPDQEHDTSLAIKEYQDFLGTPSPIGARWEDLVDIEEKLLKNTIRRNVQRVLPPIISFPVIEPTEQQKTNFPEVQNIEISFFPYKITSKSNVSFNRLFATHVAKDITEGQIRKYFEPFATTVSEPHKKEDASQKRIYPKIYIDRKTSPNSVTVSYSPGSLDGIFALCMIKKITISEKCTLNFDLYREN